MIWWRTLAANQTHSTGRGKQDAHDGVTLQFPHGSTTTRLLHRAHPAIVLQPVYSTSASPTPNLKKPDCHLKSWSQSCSTKVCDYIGIFVHLWDRILLAATTNCPKTQKKGGCPLLFGLYTGYQLRALFKQHSQISYMHTCSTLLRHSRSFRSFVGCQRSRSLELTVSDPPSLFTLVIHQQ